MEEVAKLVEELKAQYDEFVKNAELLTKDGNKAAGGRARKASLAMEKLTKEFRKKSIEATK
ncbi:MAG: histone H1 [Bacteroidales bacterium]|jgi:hypothetical protein|nr:histone H1 [Bacteroidales bacterium]